MTTSKNALPLFIKIPAIAAGFLALILVFTILFEEMPEEKPLKSCKIQKHGEFKEASLISHLFRDKNGEYIAAMLNPKKDTWLVSKFLFSADFTPYLEPLSTKENYLTAVGENTYELIGNYDDWAFVKTGQGRIVPVSVKDGRIAMHTSLGLCGAKWEDETKLTRLNQKVAVLWDSKGRLGFYNIGSLSELIPREMPKSPDTLMGVETGNVLKVESCQNQFVNTKARVRIESGILAYSSGESRNVAAYKVQPEQMDLKPLEMNFKTEQFSDFFVTENLFIGFKISDWLDRNEKWSLKPLMVPESPIKDITINHPLGFKKDYSVFGEPESTSFWVAEKWKKWGFLNRYILSHVSADGSKESFELNDENAEKALTAKGLWKIFPGNRHMFIANKSAAPLSYSLVECGL
ncbi:hypothetical protein [Bdellovibrio reynosensis]|uniref:DUF4340 domain-containing protein n=1 Tax=Bdellovibrio reynosensis TaxID=2835041 RepID=A0ABY4C941_9BACT|nr:hypothetical protein [Bdellovibrio reynosensis]UOF00181.1 hypothetical protein MNR06_10755 [Bdellovibrio reynosensis]